MNKIRQKTLTISSSKNLVKREFTIGKCLTCSNQLLSQSSLAQTAMIAERGKEGRKPLCFLETLTIRDGKAVYTAAYLLEYREKKTKKTVKTIRKLPPIK